MECEVEVNKAKCTCTYELCSRTKLLDTIMLAPHRWADRIKQGTRLEVVMVFGANHQQLVQELQAWLKG